MFNKKDGMLPEFLVWRYVLLFGIVVKKYDGDSFFRVLYKKFLFLYQRIDFEVSKPSFPKIFLVEHPPMAPVMASVTLY